MPGIVSFGLVCEQMLKEEWWEKIEHMNELRLKLYDALVELKNFKLNSPRHGVIPNTVNISIVSSQMSSRGEAISPSVSSIPLKKRQKNGEDILLELDMNGIYASSGSACSSGANLPSKVLLAMGCTAIEAKNAIRFSLGLNTTLEELEYVIITLKKLLA